MDFKRCSECGKALDFHLEGIPFETSRIQMTSRAVSFMYVCTAIPKPRRASEVTLGRMSIINEINVFTALL